MLYTMIATTCSSAGPGSFPRFVDNRWRRKRNRLTAKVTLRSRLIPSIWFITCNTFLIHDSGARRILKNNYCYKFACFRNRSSVWKRSATTEKITKQLGKMPLSRCQAGSSTHSLIVSWDKIFSVHKEVKTLKPCKLGTFVQCLQQ